MGLKTTDIAPIIIRTERLTAPGEVVTCDACGVALSRRGFYLPPDKGGPLWFCEDCIQNAQEEASADDGA